ncbi:envelope integrity protein Cei [Pseudonocardia kunmingensis]|uniref:LytR cell envelope-related transcriptional attenuator n=1 Tax=Pseudonocardia kunmingensis TaxID=630975 RepID=A0A543DWA8_9PSEU|nr:envelope integrity protein Cei [Pseudonocardia kunmingensis]TQM13601.1 LytR cell envelope-related transcriptional attenuator [Pseudonocardia kunmingensis]
MAASRTRPYQRRRRGPLLVVVAVLAVVAIATWTTVLISASGPSGASSCPISATPVGEVLEDGALDGVAPAPPAAVSARVLNAGGQRGQASLVAAQLGDLDFPTTEPGNDPLFPEGDLECYGQLRFGPAGEAAASTLSLLLPCAELVRDGRPDAIVDVAVGTAFGDFNPSTAARDALEQLAEPGGGSDGSANADPNAAGAAPAAPTVDPALVEEAREAAC